MHRKITSILVLAAASLTLSGCGERYQCTVKNLLTNQILGEKEVGSEEECEAYKNTFL
jgi:hypothetical protein